MAPVSHLRRRQPSDGFDDPDEGSSTPADRGPVNKRARLSSTAREGTPRDDDLESLASEPVVLTQMPPTQSVRYGLEEYERTRDATLTLDASAGTDDANIEQQQMQKVGREFEQNRQQASTLRGVNQEAQCGVLEQVKMNNFMCHRKQTVDLGPLINFIVGHNGSGKSAVLTAIQLCLGGKANSTNRGGSLRSFIREGQTDCTISVKIRNRGVGNYKYDLYGDSITVERHFSTNGSSGFKLKSANDRIVSTKKMDLDDINDFYAFSMDNPINVLTQDAARQFLNSSSSHEKYKFFIQGVQLEALDSDYKLLADRLDNIYPKLDQAAMDLKEKERTMEAHRNRYRASTRSAKLREEFSKAANQMAWCQVQDEEKILAQIMANIGRFEDRLLALGRERPDIEVDYTNREEGVERLKEVLRLHEQEQSPLREQKNAAGGRKEAKAEEMQLSRLSERDLNGEVSKARGHIRTFENKVAEEMDRMAAANGGSEAQQLAAITTAEEHLADVQRRRVAAVEETAQVDKDAADAKEAENRSRENLHRADQAVQEVASRLQSLQTNRDPDSAYPRGLKDVRRLIQQERWQRQPVGPLGQHMKLLKPEWTSVVERMFGGNMVAFVTDNSRDQAKLREIFRRTGYSGNIIQVDGRRFDLQEPDPRFDTLLRILQIEDDLVRNSAIINQGAEKTIFVRDRNELNHLLFSSRPANVQSGICANGREHFLRYSYGFDNMPRSDPISAWKGATRIRTSIEDQIRMARQAVEYAKDEKDNVQGHLRAAQEECRSKSHRAKQHQRKLSELKREADAAEDHVRQLKDDLAESAPQDGLLDSLKMQLQEHKEHLTTYQAQLQNQLQITADKVKELEELEGEVKKADEHLAQFDRQRVKFLHRLEQADTERKESLRRKNEFLQRVDETEKTIAGYGEQRDQQALTIADMEGKVRSFCPERVDVPAHETTKSLDAKLGRINQDIQRVRAEAGGDPVDLAATYRAAKEDLRAFSVRHQSLELLKQQLHNTIDNRQARWIQFRSHIAARAKCQFQYLLSEREHTGRIHLDHRQRTLELSVLPGADARRAASAERATKTLSGGEKSFSTICLLLSLWDAMGSPIRCLDEFDVFMDSVNRDISMQMMVQAARRSVGRQYIFISPQAMSNVHFGPDVRVSKMRDPERGQTTLEFA